MLSIEISEQHGPGVHEDNDHEWPAREGVEQARVKGLFITTLRT